MESSEARKLMQIAWETRRSSFDKPAEEQLSLMKKAHGDLVQAVALCRDGTDSVELAQALHLLANVEHDMHADDSALTLWLEAVAILRGSDNPLQLAHKLRHVGDRPGSLHHANAIRPMALLKERLGDRNQALALWREAKELYTAINIEGLDTQPTVDECNQHIGRLE